MIWSLREVKNLVYIVRHYNPAWIFDLPIAASLVLSTMGIKLVIVLGLLHVLIYLTEFVRNELSIIVHKKCVWGAGVLKVKSLFILSIL